MKKKLRALRALWLLGFLGIFAVMLSGCFANYSQGSEDMSTTRQFGQTVEVDYSFNMLNLYKRGPYELKITPIDLLQINIKGTVTNCVKVNYVVLSTYDGKPASYADCTVAVDILKEDLSSCSYTSWFSDEMGTEMDPYGSIDIGVLYTFYIPVHEPLDDIKYIAVSDRSGYYVRSGTTYWYYCR